MEIGFQANYQPRQPLPDTHSPSGRAAEPSTCSQSALQKQPSKPRGMESLPLCLAVNSRWDPFKFFSTSVQVHWSRQRTPEVVRSKPLALRMRHGETSSVLMEDPNATSPPDTRCLWAKDAYGGKDGSVVKSSSPKCLLTRLKVSTPTQRGQVAPILSVHIHLIMGRYSN